MRRSIGSPWNLFGSSEPARIEAKTVGGMAAAPRMPNAIDDPGGDRPVHRQPAAHRQVGDLLGGDQRRWRARARTRSPRARARSVALARRPARSGHGYRAGSLLLHVPRPHREIDQLLVGHVDFDAAAKIVGAERRHHPRNRAAVLGDDQRLAGLGNLVEQAQAAGLNWLAVISLWE